MSFTTPTALDRVLHSATETSLERLVPLNEAKALLGCGTTKLYELMAAGSLDARKLGRHTRITAASIAAFQASLPKAAIMTGRKGAS
jgi:excisionase family DNA binding protein